MHSPQNSSEREEIVALGVANLIAELRLVGVNHIIAFITLDMHNHLADLVKSACERHYTPGFITLGQGCDLDVDWIRPPQVTIDLVLHIGWGEVYFSLLMNGVEAVVRLNYISLQADQSSKEETTRRLARSIEANRIGAVRTQVSNRPSRSDAATLRLHSPFCPGGQLLPQPRQRDASN